MTARTATLLAAAAMMAVATPAMAQDHRALATSAAQAAADAAEAAAADATAEGMRHAVGHGAAVAPQASLPVVAPVMAPMAPPVVAPVMHHPDMSHSAMRPLPMADRQMSGAQRLGYSPQQRDAWLAECRANHAPVRDRRQGGLIGGLLGAVVGGVAGNRIADGARLGGTLIGAGVGGLAGAAIGTAIDRADERRDARREDAALDYCEDYLARYEASATAQPGYGYGYGAVPVMMVPVMMVPVAMQMAQPVQQHVHSAECREIEEWDEVVAPVRYIRPRTRAHAPRPGKLVPVSRGKLLPAK